MPDCRSRPLPPNTASSRSVAIRSAPSASGSTAFSPLAYCDACSGASGDMLVGALVHAGLPLTTLTAVLSKLAIGGSTIRAERVGQHGIHGTRVTVDVSDGVHSRTWADIRRIIERSP